MEKPKETKVTDCPIATHLLAILVELRKQGRLYVKTENDMSPIVGVGPMKTSNGLIMGIMFAVKGDL